MNNTDRLMKNCNGGLTLNEPTKTELKVLQNFNKKKAETGE